MIIVVYIQDDIGISNDHETALMQSKFVREPLLNVGFVRNTGKSNWLPSLLAEWLGIQVDINRGLLFIPLRRIESSLKISRFYIYNFSITSARKLASVAGKLVYTQPVLGSVTRLMNRHL